MRRLVLGLALLFAPTRATATYSIVAVDAVAGEVGGAGTSCVGDLDVRVIYGAVPGVGAVHAQARLHRAGRDRAVDRLRMGWSPSMIIDELAREDFDPNAAIRQYAVVDLEGRVAGFTGPRTGPYAGHAAGANFVVAGNILTGERVLSQTRAGFEAPACDLAARLMAALEAGAAEGQGDTRCLPRGVPSDSAFLRVDAPGGSVIDISVVNTGSTNPMTRLRAEFEGWRRAHPCPEPPDGGVTNDASSTASREAGVDASDLNDVSAPERNSGAEPSQDSGAKLPSSSTPSCSCSSRDDTRRHGGVLSCGLLVLALLGGASRAAFGGVKRSRSA